VIVENKIEVKKTGYSQMIILVEAPVHQEIKARALFKNTTLKDWVLQAIAEKIVREDKAK
jgi:hypothetical protein